MVRNKPCSQHLKLVENEELQGSSYENYRSVCTGEYMHPNDDDTLEWNFPYSSG